MGGTPLDVGDKAIAGNLRVLVEGFATMSAVGVALGLGLELFACHVFILLGLCAADAVKMLLDLNVSHAGALNITVHDDALAPVFVEVIEPLND
jgi:hypothetical protein